MLANSGEPDQTPRFVASDLVLHCSQRSHKKDDRLTFLYTGKQTINNGKGHKIMLIFQIIVVGGFFPYDITYELVCDGIHSILEFKEKKEKTN